MVPCSGCSVCSAVQVAPDLGDKQSLYYIDSYSTEWPHAIQHFPCSSCCRGNAWLDLAKSAVWPRSHSWHPCQSADFTSGRIFKGVVANKTTPLNVDTVISSKIGAAYKKPIMPSPHTESWSIILSAMKN